MDPIERIKASISENQAATERAADTLDRLKAETEITRVAGGRFHNTKLDVVTPFLDRRKSVDVIGHDGKPTGETEHRFDPTGDGEFLPIDEALDTWAERHPHHVKPQPTDPEARRTPTAPPRRSEMTIAQKVAYVNEHGREAYQKLRA